VLYGILSIITMHNSQIYNSITTLEFLPLITLYLSSLGRPIIKVWFRIMPSVGVSKLCLVSLRLVAFA